MEKDPFKVTISALDLAKAAGGWALELFQLHLLSPVSEHFKEAQNRGAAPMLDRELYDKPEAQDTLF